MNINNSLKKQKAYKIDRLFVYTDHLSFITRKNTKNWNILDPEWQK